MRLSMKPGRGRVRRWRASLREHNLVRSSVRTTVSCDYARHVELGHNNVEFYDRYRSPTQAAAKVAVGDSIQPVYEGDNIIQPSLL